MNEHGHECCHGHAAFAREVSQSVPHPRRSGTYDRCGRAYIIFFRTVGGPSLAYKLSQAISRNAQDRVRDELGSSRFLKSNGCSQAACVPCGVRAVRRACRAACVPCVRRTTYITYKRHPHLRFSSRIVRVSSGGHRAASAVPRAACPIGAPGRRTVSRQCPCQCPSAVPSVVPFTASRLAVPHVCAPLAVSRAACPYRALESRRRGHAKEEGPPVREGPLCGSRSASCLPCQCPHRLLRPGTCALSRTRQDAVNESTGTGIPCLPNPLQVRRIPRASRTRDALTVSVPETEGT